MSVGALCKTHPSDMSPPRLPCPSNDHQSSATSFRHQVCRDQKLKGQHSLPIGCATSQGSRYTGNHACRPPPAAQPRRTGHSIRRSQRFRSNST
eukprot:2992807-Alexandrium_andersonii.AAC.1